MAKINVLMVGTGEYTTGYVHDSASESDKGAGVVALTMFDLRRRGLIDRLLMAGVNGKKYPGIRQHLQTKISDVYAGMSVDFESFPNDDAVDPNAYLNAILQLQKGDVVTVFTPDDTHATIAEAAIRQGCHVLIAKPLVKHLHEHLHLKQLAQENDSLVAMEVHKRWDPIYRDARDRIRKLGDFSLFQAYMSQPKSQLDTFRHWAGKSSDISYYLNAHHIDFHVWSVADRAYPVSVNAAASMGVAKAKGIDTEDTISLQVSWKHRSSESVGTAAYTASWIAPKSDVHSQQRFFYMGHGGEVTVDQAHRGYTLATDATGFCSANPLFMKYEPNANNEFAGQSGYGYRSIEDFVLAAAEMRSNPSSGPADYRGKLATIDDTTWVTAILEAGRLSLDENRVVELQYENDELIALN